MTRSSSAASVVKWTKVAGITTLALPAAVIASRVNDAAGVYLMREWSRRSLAALGLHLDVEDRNNGQYDDPPYLFVHLNQTSLLESFIYAGAVPTPLRTIINVEFAAIPVLGPALVAMGGAVVVRQWPAQAKRAMNWVARMMRDGKYSYGMSIEGQRSRDGQLSPFKKGAAVLAIAAEARIVPLIVRGAREALPFGEWRPQTGPLQVVAHEPIDTRGMTLDDRHALTARLRELAERELADGEG